MPIYNCRYNYLMLNQRRHKPFVYWMHCISSTNTHTQTHIEEILVIIILIVLLSYYAYMQYIKFSIWNFMVMTNFLFQHYLQLYLMPLHTLIIISFNQLYLMPLHTLIIISFNQLYLMPLHTLIIISFNLVLATINFSNFLNFLNKSAPIMYCFTSSEIQNELQVSRIWLYPPYEVCTGDTMV